MFMNEAIEILQGRLIGAEIPPEVRDSLADDLEFAATINGDTDPTRQLLKRVLTNGVRRELASYQRPSEAVEQHVRSYHSDGKYASRVERYCAMFRPYAWPFAALLAVTVFSPQAPKIAAVIFKALHN
jgi:hypothetical protein